MTTQTTTTPAAVVQAGFEAFGKGDLAGFGEQFHADATWNHRNPDDLGGIHRGRDSILAFIVEVRQPHRRHAPRCPAGRPDG
jgi:ketosteroid isomerase-like protein